MLEQRLPDALCHSAMDLPERHARVDEPAEIIRDGVAIEPHHAGIRIDLDFRDMAAVRKSVEVGIVPRTSFQPRRQSFRKIGGIPRGIRHLADRDGALGALTTKLPSANET